jgi:hypothetical protein
MHQKMISEVWDELWGMRWMLWCSSWWDPFCIKVFAVSPALKKLVRERVSDLKADLSSQRFVSWICHYMNNCLSFVGVCLPATTTQWYNKSCFALEGSGLYMQAKDLTNATHKDCEFLKLS